MKILVDARTVRVNPSGVARVTIEILKQLENYRDLSLFAMTQKGVNKINNLKKVKVIETDLPYQFVSPERFSFEQNSMPLIIEDVKPDIIHFIDSFGVPDKLTKQIKVLLTLHDLIPMTEYRELMSDSEFLFYLRSIKISVARANKIVAISNFTKNDLDKYFGESIAKKCIVIPNGITPSLKSHLSLDSVKKTIYLTKPYILYMGNFPPRKNIIRLIKAFVHFNRKHKKQFQLIMPGRFSPKPDIKRNLQKIRSEIVKHKAKDEIILSDYISDDQKDVLMRGAKFFVYPSLYEGFGLPVLEALVRSTPVLTSEKSAMAEIARDYALFANPKNITDMASKMERLIENYWSYKEKAIIAAKKLPKQFSWSRIAKKYYCEYKKLLEEK